MSGIIRKRLDPSPYGTTTIGALLDALREVRPDAQVYYDFCGLIPCGLRSYRGYYDHLALGWSDDSEAEPTTAQQLTKILRGATGPGMQFTGWKGGEYRMTMDSPIWADNAGRASSTAIVGIEYDADARPEWTQYVYLITERVS